MSRRINSLRSSATAGETAFFGDGNRAGAAASSALERISSRDGAHSFSPVMPLGQFLFEYLHRCGVRHSFGIPGDFALPTFTWLEKSKIQNITMTHEPAAGFAADMTGAEISTAVRLGLNPIIIVLNNNGYGTMRKIREGCFNVITQWNYSKICDLVGGGEGITASTTGKFDDALAHAQKSNRVHVIELRISRDDASHQLSRIAAEVRKMRGKQPARPTGNSKRIRAQSL